MPFEEALTRLRLIDDERARLVEMARTELLDAANAAVAGLNELGFRCRLHLLWSRDRPAGEAPQSDDRAPAPSAQPPAARAASAAPEPDVQIRTAPIASPPMAALPQTPSLRPSDREVLKLLRLGTRVTREMIADVLKEYGRGDVDRCLDRLRAWLRSLGVELLGAGLGWKLDNAAKVRLAAELRTRGAA